MGRHLCIQCAHYEGSGSPSGYCRAAALPVWSRRQECAAGGPSRGGLDLFEPLDTLGNRLRTAREEAGLSRDEVCRRLSIAEKSLRNWETDERKPPDHTVRMLTDFYKAKRT